MEKRIAFISEHASPLAMPGSTDSGGQNVYVMELTRELAKIGYQVDIFTRWEHAYMPQVVRCNDRIRVVHIPAGPKQYIEKEQLLPYMNGFRRHLVDFILQQGLNYELIHANFFMSAQVAMEVKMILGIPFVVTFHALGHIRRLHQGTNDRFPAERMRIERDAIRFADRIIAECPQDREDLIQHYHAPAEKIVVVPCGVNTSEFYRIPKEAARQRLNLPDADCTLLQLGRIVPRKGIENVIRALAVLRNRNLDARLLIVGGDLKDLDRDTELSRLKKTGTDLGVAAWIRFEGQKEQQKLKYYYSAADIFITTPWYEPFGITPLEAMACQTPVIGSRVGGITYSVKEGETGALVPPEDPDALADAVLELCSQPGYLKTLGSRGLARVQTLFTWERIARKMAGVYQEITADANMGMEKVV
ncbi:glycosyltransferase [Niabella sp. CC-SYL272]|uniref:glycosyltransferase n=1 Tax=Niabella agricola TaxID=2891571 RepID=UPI001F3AED66|nr:glycosyltransferase [Niabella agricola]MCF3108333.1 glycosyltransferase [Niabella agricola]